MTGVQLLVNKITRGCVAFQIQHTRDFLEPPAYWTGRKLRTQAERGLILFVRYPFL